MGVIQIALLWTLIGVLILLAIGGFLYIRSRQYIAIMDEEFERVNKFNIDTFNKRLARIEKRDKLGILTPSVEKLRSDVEYFNKTTYRKYELVYEEQRKRLTKWWSTPFQKLTKDETKHIPESHKKDLKWRPFLVNKIIVENFERFTLQNRSIMTERYFDFSKLNQSNESKDLIIHNMKELYGSFKKIYKESKYQQLKDHPTLAAHSKRIREHIKMLEENVDNKTFKEIKAPIKKMLKEISEFGHLVIFLDEGYRELNDTISLRWIRLKKIIEENERVLEKVTKDFEQKFNLIRSSSVKLEKALHQANAKVIENEINKINQALFFMETQVEKNIEAYALYKTRRKEVFAMIEELNKKKDQLIKEIDRHNLDKDDSKKQTLIKSVYQINERYNALLDEEKLVFGYTTPWRLLEMQRDVIESYKDHLISIKQLVTDIKNILSATDDATKIIAELNIEILNAEYRLKLLPKSLRLQREYKLNRYQREVNDLVSKYKGRDISPSKEDVEEIQRVEKKVNEFWQGIDTDVLLVKYVKEAILILSKYQENKKVAKNLEWYKQLYNEGQLKLALEELYPVLIKLKK